MELWGFAFQQEPPGALLVGHGAALPSSAQHRLPLCFLAKSEQGNNLLWASRADGSPLRITIPFVCVCIQSLHCTVGAWLPRLSPAVPLWMIQIQGHHSALTAEHPTLAVGHSAVVLPMVAWGSKLWFPWALWECCCMTQNHYIFCYIYIYVYIYLFFLVLFFFSFYFCT